MKKLLSLILAVMMVISAFSVTALADGMNALDLAPVGEAAVPAEEPAEQEQPAAPAEEPTEEPAADGGAVLIKTLVVSKLGSDITKVEKYALTPEFNPNTKDYTTVIPDNVNNIKVWVELLGGGENAVAECKYQAGKLKRTVKLDTTKGSALVSFIAMKSIAGNTATIVSYDGKTEESKTEYTLTVKRRATLGSLNLSENANPDEKIVLSEAFNANTTKYTAYIGKDTKIKVNAVPTSAAATVMIEGATDGVFIPNWNEHACEMKVEVSGNDAVPTVYIIELKEKPSSLEIVSAPQKTEYTVGEIFDVTGLSVKAKYPDDEEIIQNDELIISPNGALKEENTKITISYNGVSVEQPIKVSKIEFKGSGTENDPYIIETPNDLKNISNLNLSGELFKDTYFKFSDNIESITLPDKWIPIGMSSRGFAGNINGNGKTLIVPKDSLSLIGAPNGCTIENLSIYGEKIPGYGLVENYTVSCTGTIKNITIKSGSHILKSGLLGGYGNESVNIYDCTIEKGVVIGDDGTWGNLADEDVNYPFASPIEPLNGHDMIGSFCGAWNGTITNCVSYATVYGRNYVGGIVGFKGQSMRKFIVNNCAFYGDIIAAGEGVGGIVGSGYLAGSAPNSPCVTIENCYATGSIKGKNKVGGIFGGELGVKNNWGNGIGRVRGNYFCGTVSATGENASVGGVIGFMKSMDIYNDVQGNYFVDDCGTTNGIGAVETVFNADKVSYSMYTAYGRDDDPMTSELVTKKITRAQVTNGELVKLLNSGKYGRDNWQQGSEYPVFGEGKHIIGITSTGLYDDSVNSSIETNPALTIPNNGSYESLYEKNILVKYSDGTQKVVKASEGEFGGVDFNETKKVQLATLTYGNYELTFGVKVFKPATGNIKVSLQVLGDTAHGAGGTVHTLKNGNLTEWFPMTEFDDVPNNSNVFNFISKKLTAKDVGMKLTNTTGNYISAVEYNGIKLSEGDNGENSCWQFTINGVNSSLGVAQQDLSDGDVIVLYFTDDYTKENPTANYDEVKAVKELIEAIGTVTKDSGEAINAARKAYDALGDAEKSYVDNYDKLVKAEQIYDMIIASNKPAASDKSDKANGSVIHIAANGASKGEQNPNTGAPAMSMAPAVLVLAAAALALKKRG